MSQWPAKPGARRGLNWSIRRTEGKRLRAIRHVLFDANYWKSFLHSRLAVAMGDKGCLSLWGRKSARHMMLAEHLTAEAGALKVGRGRTVVQWKPRPGGGDNHWLDCLTGCAVGASILGVKLAVLATTCSKRTSRRRVRYMG